MRIICLLIGHRWEAIWTPIGVRWGLRPLPGDKVSLPLAWGKAKQEGRAL